MQAGTAGYLLKQTQRAGLLAALRDVHDGEHGAQGRENFSIASTAIAQMSPDDAALSPGNGKFLELLAWDYVYKEIADSLSINLPTVNTYVRRIYEKITHSFPLPSHRQIHALPHVGRTPARRALDAV